MKRKLVMIPMLLAACSALADEPPAKLDHLSVCRADVQKLCPDVRPGGGRIVACLKENKDKLSDTCRQRLQQMREQHLAGKRQGRQPVGSNDES